MDLVLVNGQWFGPTHVHCWGCNADGSTKMIVNLWIDNVNSIDIHWNANHRIPDHFQFLIKVRVPEPYQAYSGNDWVMLSY